MSVIGIVALIVICARHCERVIGYLWGDLNFVRGPRKKQSITVQKIVSLENKIC